MEHEFCIRIINLIFFKSKCMYDIGIEIIKLKRKERGGA